MRTLLIAAVIAGGAGARANPPTLVSQEAGAFAVSLPKAWTVVSNAAQGTIIAQQDPTRKDAAQLMLMVAPHTQASDDEVLDTVLKNGLPNAKVTKREALPNGGGKLLVADGEAEGITARLGAIAVAASGGVIVGVLIAKPADFDTVGGVNTVVAVLASMRITGGVAPAGFT